MTEATYRIIAEGTGFKVAIDRPGATNQVAGGFSSAADAQAWIDADRRITGIDDRQRSIAAPQLRQC